MSTTTSHKEHKEINCLVLGDRGIGLTSLLQRITTGQYWDIYEPEVTIEDAWRYQTVHAQETCLVSLDQTDGNLNWRPGTYPQPDLILLCFSVVDHASFESVAKQWYPDLQTKLFSPQVVLVGTKSDLRTSDEALEDLRLRHQGIIQDSQGVALANEMEALGYFPCSAKTGQGIEQLKELIVREGRANTKTIHESLEAKTKQKKKNAGCVIM